MNYSKSSLLLTIIVFIFFGKLYAMSCQRFAGTNNNGEIKVFNFRFDDYRERKDVIMPESWSISSAIMSVFNHKIVNKSKKILLNNKIASLEGYIDSKLVFSPINKDIVAYNCKDGRIVVYDISKQKEITVLSGHCGKVNSIAFSFFNENELISGSDDMTVRVWNFSKLEGSRCISISNYHDSPVYNVIFSPTSPYFYASVSADGKIFICDLSGQNSSKVIKTFCIESESDESLLFSINSVKFNFCDTHIISYYEHTRTDSNIKILDFSRCDNMLIAELHLSKIITGFTRDVMRIKNLDSTKLFAFSKSNSKIIVVYGFENNILGENFTENIFIYNIFTKKLRKNIERLDPYKILELDCKIRNKNSKFIFSDIQFDCSNGDIVFSFCQDGSEIKVYDINQEKYIAKLETGEVFNNGTTSIYNGISNFEAEFKNKLVSLKNKKYSDVLINCEN